MTNSIAFLPLSRMLFSPRKFAPQLALIAFAAYGAQVHALGMGPLMLKSRLGDPFQAQVAIHGVDGQEISANCIKSRITALDGNLLSSPTAQLTGNGPAAIINITGSERLAEPVLNITVELHCASSIKRSYQVLLDPDPAMQLTTAQTQPVRPLLSDGLAEPGRARPQASATTPAAPKTPVTHKPPAPRKVNPAPLKSVLTLSTADAEVEAVRASLVLKYATTLSEPGTETDKARLAQLHADQARVAALLRGDDPSAPVQAELQKAEQELRKAKQSALSLKQQLASEKAAFAGERQDWFPQSWIVMLGGLLAASIAATVWLLRCRADDKRRYQNELQMLAAAFGPSTQLEPEPPIADTAASEAPADRPLPTADSPPAAPFATAIPEPTIGLDSQPADSAHAAAVPQAFDAPLDWNVAPVDFAISVPPLLADSTDTRPGSEGQNEELLTYPAVPLQLDVAASLERSAHAQASEVADMLLAAEDWMDEHNPLRAAALLRPYMEREDMLSPAPGMYLAALYRTAGDEAQVQAVQAQLERYFPEQAGAGNADNAPGLTTANCPDVAAMISGLPQTGDRLPYLKSLLLAPHQLDFSAYREIVHAIRTAVEPTEAAEMDFFR